MRGTRLIAPCFVTLAGVEKEKACIFICDSGTSKVEQPLLAVDEGLPDAVCVSNMDPNSGEFPPIEVLSLNGEACGPLVAKDICQGESLLRRDFALKWMRRVKGPTVSEGIESGRGLMQTVPIANEATLYSTVMCPRTNFYESRRSPGLGFLMEV